MRKRRSWLNVIDLEWIAWSPSVAAAFAMISAARKNLVASFNPLVADEEKTIRVSKARRGKVCLGECELHLGRSTYAAEKIAGERVMTFVSPYGFCVNTGIICNAL